MLRIFPQMYLFVSFWICYRFILIKLKLLVTTLEILKISATINILEHDMFLDIEALIN